MKHFIIALSLSVCAMAAQATSPQVTIPDEPVMHLPLKFGNIDSDQDGYVSKAEADSLSGLELNFDVADANQDGQLNEQEFTNAIPVQ